MPWGEVGHYQVPREPPATGSSTQADVLELTVETQCASQVYTLGGGSGL